MKKVLRAIVTVLITLVVIVSVFTTIATIASTIGDDQRTKVPNLFGKAIMAVETDSMEGPDGFPAGSVIIVDMLTWEEANNLNVGDVVTFIAHYGKETFFDTHRIIEKTFHGSYNYYKTKGDNTVTFDKDFATAENIIGVWTGISIPKLGSAIGFIQKPTGFLVCIVVPMAIFFFFELYRFIVTLSETKRLKAVAAVNNAEEEIKAKAIAEYLAQQQAQAQPAPAPTQPAPPKTKTEEEIKQEAVAAFLAQQQAAQAPSEPPRQKTEEEIKQEAIAEFLAKQQAAQAPAEPPKPKTEEEIKQEAIAEYLAKQAAESNNTPPTA